MGRTKTKDDVDGQKLPWTDAMNLSLLKLVKVHWAHLPHITYDKKNPVPTNGKPVYHSRPADRFREVAKDFYDDPKVVVLSKTSFSSWQRMGPLITEESMIIMILLLRRFWKIFVLEISQERKVCYLFRYTSVVLISSIIFCTLLR